MPAQPAPPSDRLTTSKGCSTPVADSPNAWPMAAITSASENTIGDQRSEADTCAAVDAGQHDLGRRGQLLDERGDEDAVAVILVDEAVAVDVVVHQRTDRRHAGCGSGVVGGRVDDEHTSRATLADSGIARLDRVVGGPEAR